MDIAGRFVGIKVAEHELVEMKDGEKAYFTRRFDRRGGEPIQQVDFCKLAELVRLHSRTRQRRATSFASTTG